jgi:hypothetical protein
MAVPRQEHNKNKLAAFSPGGKRFRQAAPLKPEISDCLSIALHFLAGSRSYPKTFIHFSQIAA